MKIDYKKLVSIILIILMLVACVLERGNPPSLSGKNVVCLGDSIIGNWRDETGVAYWVGELTDATVYNCSVGGAAASIHSVPADSDDYEYMMTTQAHSLVAAIEAISSGDYSKLDQSQEAVEILKTIDFSDVDYVIIEYGLNDYFTAYDVHNDTDSMDITTYGGALRTAVEYFQTNYPDMGILISSPTYCQFYSYGQVASDSDDTDMGNGQFLPAYVAEAKAVSEEYEVMYSENYNSINSIRKDAYKMLADGVHLNEKGRYVLAKKFAKLLNADAIAKSKGEGM